MTTRSSTRTGCGDEGLSTDPFGTAALREGVLTAWRSSPTRFREDANAESDLVLHGYSDRLAIELASNAADAAQRAGHPGHLRFTVDGGELRVANTGAALDAAGVAALTALRASTKRGQAGATGGGAASADTVGRFGLGFAAVLPVSAEPRIVSTSGGVRFSAACTAAEIADDEPLRSELARRGGDPPVLRLVWPVDEPGPPAGFDTEVRLPLRTGLDAAAVLDSCVGAAGDLLLVLDWLVGIDVGEHTLYRTGHDPVRLDVDDRAEFWRLVGRSGRLDPQTVAALGPEARDGWTVRWALPVDTDGRPRALGDEVLHAPTATGVRLSLPARLIAEVPVEPDRRHVAPGPATDAVLDAAAAAYPELTTALDELDRTALVPAGTFPASELDATLRAGVLEALRGTAWLPAADGGVLAPPHARALDRPLPELARLLAEVDASLLRAELGGYAHASALAALGVPRIGADGVVELLARLTRPPEWWRRCYAAVSPLVETGPDAVDELAALPVPLLDGRTVTGPRGVLLADDTPDLPELDVPGLRIVHPQAAHPLLERLGARRANPGDLLDALRGAIEASMETAETGRELGPLARTTLTLASADSEQRPWLGALALPDTSGQPARADELMLPDAAIAPVLAADGPLGVPAAEVVAAYSRRALRAVGVLDGFAVLDETHPGGPDHDLDDEEAWWAGIGDAEPPERLLAVRDLDLVDDRCWPEALRLLAADPDTAAALAQPGGYTGWWLARHARLGGRAPGEWAVPQPPHELAGLYDPVPVSDVALWALTAVGVRDSLRVSGPADAADLLARLAEPGRAVRPAAVHAAHAALCAAVAAGRLDPGELDPPERVRASSGAVMPADRAVVLDTPWLAPVLADDDLVAGGEPAVLAELLDVPLATQACPAELAEPGAGRAVAWTELVEVVTACAALDLPVPAGELVLHETLWVRSGDAEYRVPFWVTDGGAVHATDPVRALVLLRGPAGHQPDR